MKEDPQGSGSPAPDASEPGATPEPDSVSEFAADLTSLRRAADRPTLDALAKLTGVSKSVLSEAFAGRRLPTENTVRRLTAALGADPSTWVARRRGLDRRFSVATEPSPPVTTSAAPSVVMEEADLSEDESKSTVLTRPVSFRTFLIGIAATAAVSIAASSALAMALLGRPASSQAAPAPASTFLSPANGADPMQTACRDDVVLAGGDEFLDGAVLVEMMYSTSCMAVWGRVTRFDGLSAGNTITMRIYPKTDPDSERSQSRSELDLQSVYTRMLIEPDVDARVCGIASVTVGEETFEQPNPVCI